MNQSRRFAEWPGPKCFLWSLRQEWPRLSRFGLNGLLGFAASSFTGWICGGSQHLRQRQAIVDAGCVSPSASIPFRHNSSHLNICTLASYGKHLIIKAAMVRELQMSAQTRPRGYISQQRPSSRPPSTAVTRAPWTLNVSESEPEFVASLLKPTQQESRVCRLFG